MSEISDKAVYLIDGLVGAVRDSFTTKSRWCRWDEHHFMDELRKYIHSLETEVTTLRAENKSIKACPFCERAEKAEAMCERMVEAWALYRNPPITPNYNALMRVQLGRRKEIDDLVSEWKERKDETD